jgi:Cu(I)/Ag(I) efflux system protein CusF
MARGLLLKSVAAVVAIAMSSSVLATQLSLAAEPEDQIDEMSSAALPTPQAAPLASGKIVMINRDARQIEVEHRPIDEFYLQGTTTVFKVADPGLLSGLAPGDKIRFKAERHGRGYVVTRIENSN